MTIHSFRLDTATQTCRDGKLRVGIHSVLHTASLKTERECAQRWPRAVQSGIEFGPADMLAVASMRSFATRALKQDPALRLALEAKGWLEPLTPGHGAVRISVTGAACRIWTDPMLPFVEVDGEVELDLQKVLTHYLKANWFTVKRDARFIREDLEMRLSRPLPLLMTYQGQTAKDELLRLMLVDASKAGAGVAAVFAKATGLKNVYKLRKTGSWIGVDTVRFEVNDVMALLAQRVRKDIVPLTIGGLVAREILREVPRQ